MQAQYSVTMQCPMCELCPGQQVELTVQQSDLRTVSSWPGKRALKKQRPSCTLRCWWTYGPGATSECAVSTSNPCKGQFSFWNQVHCQAVWLWSCAACCTHVNRSTQSCMSSKWAKIVEERESEPLWQALLALRFRPLTVKV